MLLVVLVMGCLWGGICSGIAVKKHRDGTGWFVAGFLFGLLGLLAVAAMSALPDPRAHDTEAFG